MLLSSVKNKLLRITIRVIIILAALLLIVLTGISVYINANKESILEKVNASVNKNISGKLEVKDIDVSTITTFPSIAINLKDVSLLDSVYKKPLLNCKEVSCRINIFKLGDIQNQLSKVVISDGSVQLYTDTAGYSNTSILFKPKKAPTASPAKPFVVHQVLFDNINFFITNDQKKKEFAFHVEDLKAGISRKDSILGIKTYVNTTINKMIFNHVRGSYLENNSVEGTLNLFFNTTAKTLKCEESKIEVNDQPFTVTASFAFNESHSFNIDLKSDEVQYEYAILALTPRLRERLKAIAIEDPISVHVSLNGLLQQNNIPVTTAEWETTNNKFSSGPVVFDECSFKGKYTNNLSDTLPHTDEFSLLSFEKFTGNWRGLELAGSNIKITNLLHPNITFNFASKTTLPAIDNALGSDALTFLEGDAAIALSYNGPLVADPAQLKNLNANLEITNGKILYQPKNITLEKCSGLMAVEDNALVLHNFQFDFKNNHFLVNVVGNDVGNLSKTANAKASLQFNIQSPYIHLDEIFSVLSPTEKRSKRKRKAQFAATAGKIDNLLENSNWRVNVNADKISKANFYAEKLRANITLDEDDWNIDHLSLYHAGGSINATGQLYQRSQKTSAVKADVQMQHINIKDLFYGFSNFGQNSLTSANLRGVLDASAHINTLINNNDGSIVQRSTTGAIDFSLKDGAIINHKGLEEMKLLFLKNRDMSNIRFAELKDRIDITPDYLYINKMEIQSTAISMYLEGQYDIYGKNTDMLIQVPFTNFGKRDESVPVKNKGLNAKTGLSIWINAKNDQYGEIKFTPRLSKKKFMKDKAKK